MYNTGGKETKFKCVLGSCTRGPTKHNGPQTPARPIPHLHESLSARYRYRKCYNKERMLNIEVHKYQIRSIIWYYLQIG